jgi:hypothetical protein
MNQIFFFKPFDYYYFNPTSRNYINIIENMPNVTIIDCYNFKDVNIDDNSLLIFLPFTLFGINENQFISTSKRIKKAYFAPNFKNIDFELANNYYNVFNRAYLNSKNTIAILTEYDPHALIEDKLITNFINRDTDYLLLAGPELYDFNFHNNQHPDIDMNKFNKAYHFLSENRNRIISLMHFMDISEFSRIDDLYCKKNRLRSAPGARYLNRKLFLENQVTKNRTDYFKSIFDYLILKSIWQIPLPKLKIKLIKIYFDNIIKNSVFTYTCGSTAGFFIRKFLEIPANNSCLVTHNYKFLKSLGFVENQHYLQIENIIDFASPKDFYSNLEAFKKVHLIILNSRKLIFEKHSIISHHQYLLDTIDKIKNKTFNGSYWEDGYYKFY